MLFRRREKPGWVLKLKALFWPRKGFRRPFQYFGMRILRLNATPHAIAAGVAAGVISSWTPFMGFHFILSFALAYAVAGNMIAAALGTAFGNPLTFPFLWGTSWEIGNYMLGDEGTLSGGGTLDLHHLYNTLSFSEMWRPIIKPMLLGAIPPALFTGFLAYMLFFFGARTFQARRRERLMAVAQARMAMPGEDLPTV